MKTTCNSAWLTVLFVAAAMPAMARGGLAFGPALVLVENIAPAGGETDVFGKGEMTFVIYNRSDQAGWYHLGAVNPGGDPRQWEKGYEAIPDASWCRLDIDEVEVAAKTNQKIRLFINVPAKPEYFNRKWMLYVTCAPGKKPQTPKATGVGLQVASRVQIETASNAASNPAVGGALAIVPAQVSSSAAPSAELEHSVKVSNNTKEDRRFKILRLNEIEKEAEKYERYFGKDIVDGKPLEPVIGSTWITCAPAIELKAGETKEFTIKLTIPKDARPGGNFEELLFLQDEKGLVNFLRVRTKIFGGGK